MNLMSDRKKEDNPVGGDKIKTETMPQVKQDTPINDIEDSKRNGWKQWGLRGMRVVKKNNDRAKHFPSKETIVCSFKVSKDNFAP